MLGSGRALPVRIPRLVLHSDASSSQQLVDHLVVDEIAKLGRYDVIFLTRDDLAEISMFIRKNKVTLAGGRFQPPVPRRKASDPKLSFSEAVESLLGGSGGDRKAQAASFSFGTILELVVESALEISLITPKVIFIEGLQEILSDPEHSSSLSRVEGFLSSKPSANFLPPIALVTAEYSAAAPKAEARQKTPPGEIVIGPLSIESMPSLESLFRGRRSGRSVLLDRCSSLSNVYETGISVSSKVAHAGKNAFLLASNIIAIHRSLRSLGVKLGIPPVSALLQDPSITGSWLGQSLLSEGQVQSLCLFLTAQKPGDQGSIGLEDFAQIFSSKSCDSFTQIFLPAKSNDSQASGLVLSPLEEELASACAVENAALTVTFDCVGALAAAKEAVFENVILPIRKPELFTTPLLRDATTSGVLLFGPPGTGKTLLAKAIAKECGCNFLCVTTSELLDMYVGQSEKRIKALFSLARKLSPCVIFFDEVDSVVGRRGTGAESNKVYTAVTNQLMSEIDGLRSGCDPKTRLIFVAATNRPMALDEAMLRRFQRRILIDLPGEKERGEILSVILRQESLAKDVSLAQIAERTGDFSGSDLRSLCRQAARFSLREVLQNEASDAVAAQPLAMRHFEAAMAVVRPVATQDSEMLVSLREWSKQYAAAADGAAAPVRLGFQQA